MSRLLKKLEEREEREAKQEEAAFVKREKQADDAAQQKLEEIYGAAKKFGQSDYKRRKCWKCAECAFENYSQRNACGRCLATNPECLRNPGRNDKAPAKSCDPEVRIVTVKNRCYRTFRGDAPGSLASKRNGGVPLTRGQLTDDGAAPATCGTSRFADFTYDSDEDDEPGCCEQEDDEAGVPTIRYDPTMEVYSLKLNIPPRYYKFLIGAKGATLQETQRLTGATVIVPKETDENDFVVIKGPTESSVAAAQIRTDSIIMQSKDKVEYSHFLSIPLGTIPSVKNAMETLMHDMSAACCDEEADIEPSLFQTPVRLHLTLLCLRLHTEEEMDRAKAIMLTLEDELARLFTRNDHLTLKGLNYMNDDPTEVHVVYLELEKDEQHAKLSKLIQVINTAFIQAGLALDKDIAHNEKLHATVMNSKWRESTAAGGPRIAFDATNVFQLFGKVCLGSHRLRHLELNVLGGGRRTGEGEGYYQCEHSINFPE